jgi:hypothetical protein
MPFELIVGATICILAAIVTAKNRHGFWRAIRALLAVASVLGFLNGLGFLCAEFPNHNDGKFYDAMTDAVDLFYASEMCLVAAVTTIAVSFALEFAAYLVCRPIFRRQPG